MIDVIFRLGSDIIFVRVDGINLYFGNSHFGSMMSTIDGIKINKEGVLKEFPELKDDAKWKSKAIERFKVRVKEMPTEEKRIEYIITDLKKYGYVPMYKQKQGFRKEVLHG